MDDGIPAEALGELLGISGKQVRLYARRGIILRKGKLFDWRASLPRYCAHLRDLATGRGGEAAGAAAAAARKRLAEAQAERTSKLKTLSGAARS